MPVDPRMFTDPRGMSLGALAELSWQRWGERSTVLFEGAELTSGELGARARRVAGGLVALGVRPGDRVAVCMTNCPEVLETYHAVWRVGAVTTPLLFLLSPAELRHAVIDSGAVAVVTTPEIAPKVRAAIDGLDVRFVSTGPPEDHVVSYDELATSAEAPLADVDPSGLAALLYTGGTTGRSKGVMLSHDAMSSAAWSGTVAGLDDSIPDAEPSVSLLPLPLAHAYGLLVVSLSLHATTASRTVLMRWFEPAAWLQLAQDHRVQAAAAVPTMLRVLLAQPLESYDLSHLERIVSGSAPLPQEVLAEWNRRVPGVEVVEGYGCSETAALVSTTSPGGARAGSVGRAAPGSEIRIEAADGSPAPVGIDGEICVRSPTLMSGYWHDPETTSHALRDGWFHTGDIGHLDADGYLFIVDRMKDVIIRGGFNVYPRDVEEVLMTHPSVAFSAVVGRPDTDHGEEVVAFAMLHDGASVTTEELIAWARERLSAVKYPREVHILDQLPLTSIGKLDRKALRAHLKA